MVQVSFYRSVFNKLACFFHSGNHPVFICFTGHMFAPKDANLKELVVAERAVVSKCREDVEAKCTIIKLFLNLILKDVLLLFIKLLLSSPTAYEYCL